MGKCCVLLEGEVNDLFSRRRERTIVSQSHTDAESIKGNRHAGGNGEVRQWV